jgi:AraC-like DNA-binding protein
VIGIRFFKPCEELQDIVARIYAHDSGPALAGDSRWLIVPDGEIKLIFPFRGDISCRIGETERLHRRSRLILSGMRTEPGALAFPTGVDAVGIIVKPEAAYRLVDPPHDSVTNCTLDGEEVFNAAARRWQDELMQLQRLDDRIAHLQRRLCEWLRARDRRDLAFEYAVRRLRQHHGGLRIEELARDIGWSRRHLERRFLQRLGVGPKSFASVVRFHAVYKSIRQLPATPHARAPVGDLIYRHYFDQAHFTKAFKRYAGVPPTTYFRMQDYGRVYIPR